MNTHRFTRYGILGMVALCLLIPEPAHLDARARLAALGDRHAVRVAPDVVDFSSAASVAPRTSICHKPGTPDQEILTIANAGLPGHYRHGDYSVAPEICDGRDSDCDNPIVVDNGVSCSDGIACTVDSCAGVLGCAHAPDDARCDDSDPRTADRCNANTGCVHTPLCGNGTLDVDAGEQCDDGNTRDGDGCSATCTIEHYCGDGVVDAGEECDDGNNTDGDGCSSACVLEVEVETVYAVAYTDMRADDGDYNPDVDVLIAKIVEASGDNVLGPGDKVVTFKYPSTFEAGFEFKNFQVTEHAIATVTVGGSFIWVNALRGFFFEKLSYAEDYEETSDPDTGDTWFTDYFISSGEPFVVDRIKAQVLSWSQPSFPVIITRPGNAADDQFVDIELYPNGKAIPKPK